jgi:hypothetical protein
MNVKGNACSHTPHDHLLQPGVDSRCERCQKPLGVIMKWDSRGRGLKRRTLRLWYEGSTQRFTDRTVRVSA